MSDNNSQQGGKFLPGFLFGTILGGGIVYLLGTKKGKKILQTITEEGLEGISTIEDLVEEVAEEYDEPEVLPVVSKDLKKEEVVEEKPSGVKRFFKGTRKK